MIFVFYLLSIWALYLILAPFYIFPSGMPQPADFILMLGVVPALIFAFFKSHKHIHGAYTMGALFTGLTFVINLVHFVILPDTRFFMSSLFYLYNFCVFIFVVLLARQYPQQFQKIVYACLILSVFLQFVFAALLPFSQTIRATGSFNNPNQLGYWALLTGCVLIVAKGRKPLGLLDFTALALLFYIQLLSLSKAGILSFGFVLLVAAFSPLTRGVQKFLLFAMLTLALIYTVFNAQSIWSSALQINTIEAASNRLGTIGRQNDDSLEGRGYTRVASHPHFLILGAGEGGFSRFPPFYANKEIHSGLVTIIFSYGILGAVLFTAFLVQIFRRSPWFYASLLVPILLYGLTHQNIRNTYFWVFLAIVFVFNEFWRKEKRAP